MKMKVLKFGAKWCPGCIVMKPRWEEVEKENPWLETEFYDYDENPEMAKKYDIKELPEFIFLDKEGNEITRMKGEIEKEALVDAINQYRES